MSRGLITRAAGAVVTALLVAACAEAPSAPTSPSSSPATLPPPRATAWQHLTTSRVGETLASVARVGSRTYVAGAIRDDCCNARAALWSASGGVLQPEKVQLPGAASISLLLAEGDSLIVGGIAGGQAAAWRYGPQGALSPISLGSKTPGTPAAAASSASATHFAIRTDDGVELVSCDVPANANCRSPIAMKGDGSSVYLAATPRLAVAALAGTGMPSVWYAQQATGWKWQPAQLPEQPEEVMGVLASGDDVLVLSKYANGVKVLRATSGTDWRSTASNFPFTTAKMARVGDAFAAVAGVGDLLQLSVSSDGVNWTPPQAAPEPRDLRSPAVDAVAGGNEGLAIIGTSSGEGLTSNVWQVRVEAQS